ncbi:MAG: hypothetical protein IMZ53_02940 [Thermoplasmata archaeon]|nr:hypothetical protein [Thermoplasmata archaeon]
MASDASKGLVSVSNLASWIAGTTNRVTVTDDGDGTVTLSGPQDIHTGASPTFAGLTVGSLSGLVKATAGVLSAVTDNSAHWDTAYSHAQIVTGNPHSLDYSDIGLSANQVIDWTANTANNFLITGTLGAGAITGTSFIIGADTVTTTQFHFLTDLNQHLSTTSTPRFENLGIGVAANAAYGINVSQISTAGTVKGISLIAQCTRSLAGGASVTGVDFQAQFMPVGNTIARTIGAVYGGYSNVSAVTELNSNYNTTITNARCYHSALAATELGGGSGVANIGTGTMYYAAAAIKGAGTITTVYSFYDAGQTAATTNWGLGINTQSYINANLSIGKATAPSVALDVVGAGLFTTTLGVTGLITAAGGIAVTGRILQQGQTQVYSATKTLTDGSATGFVEIALAAGDMIGGTIEYTITATDGTELQSHSGSGAFVAVRKVDTVTSDFEESYLPAAEAEVITSGTLTDDFTITDGAGKITINCNANSSLATPTVVLKYTIKLQATNVITFI